VVVINPIARRRYKMSASPACLLVLALVAIVVCPACRVPDPPVLKDKSRGLVYDTAMEQKIRSGDAPKIVTAAFSRYVDTLAEPVAITNWSSSSCQWQIFVATNRDRFNATADLAAENRVLESVAYGQSEVTLPRQQRGKDPKLASSRKPMFGIVKRGSTEENDIAQAKSQLLSESEFLAGVNNQLERSRQQDLLVFVHGFNVSFDAAVIRTAQIGLDMPFNGALVAYCWPSQGGVFNYDDDEQINKASVAPFTEFLTTLRAGVPAETRINIVVHSMGNRIVMESLSNLAEPRRLDPNDRKPFTNVVLCAPDVGHGDFRKWASGVVAQAERVTLYANSSDTALIASKGLHAEHRAGDSEKLAIADGIESIDCSRIDFTFMGHSYYGSNTDVLSDLFMLLKEDRPAAQRPHLAKLTSAEGRSYFQFAESAPAILCTWHFDE
jgi:esterase/lipase superfamily enzyme